MNATLKRLLDDAADANRRVKAGMADYSEKHALISEMVVRFDEPDLFISWQAVTPTWVDLLVGDGLTTSLHARFQELSAPARQVITAKIGEPRKFIKRVFAPQAACA